MILANEAETAALGARLARAARPGDVITLSGPLGVGKTALARGLIAVLGHDGDVPSPSFLRLADGRARKSCRLPATLHSAAISAWSRAVEARY
jgi:tRNA A37 threonylcarbamoyladenosine biosynthesis protein TsaE